METNKTLKDESKISAAQLIKEITPLIKDFFICEVVESVHALNLNFANGQKFLLIAKEVKE